MRKLERLFAVISLFLVSLVAITNAFAQSSNTWSAAGQMIQTRTGAAAALLSDGRVLITGGTDSNGMPQISAEIFDPVTGQFTQAAAMHVARANHAAIALTTGDVLVTGGLTDGGGYSDTAEIFSAQSNSWTMLDASLGSGLAKHAMATLADGNVLIAGGESTSGPMPTLLLFRLSDQSISPVGSLLTARTDAAAAATPDGRVLVAGGKDINAAVLNSTEIFVYSPESMSGTVSAGPNMTSPRTNATVTTTYDGVAVIGGSNGSVDLGSAEIFSQWTNTFRAVNGATPRSGHIAALLPKNGSILAMGGTGGAAVDLLQPWGNNLAGAFVAGVPSTSNHADGITVPGSLGTLLATGGAGPAGSAAELYWFPTISTDQPDYAPGTPVVMTGVGFQAGETVKLYMREWVNKMLADPADYTVTADASGAFTFTGYSPTTSDIGARYHLTAVGGSSGYQAQTVFTDATNITSGTIATRDASCTTNNSTFHQGQNVCASISVTGVSGSGGAGSFLILWSNPSNQTVQTTTVTVPTSVPAPFSDSLTTSVGSPTGTWTVKLCKNTGCGGGNLVASTTFTLAAPITTTLIVPPVTGIYGGSVSLSATLTVTSGGAAVSGQTVTFKLNGSDVGTAVTVNNGTATLNGVSLSGINAGSYPSSISASFGGSSGYASSDGTGNLTVSATTATINVKPYSVTYDANPHTATGTATGVGGVDLSANLNLSRTTHSNAGTYANDGWTFHDPNGNYADASGTVSDVIKQATANVTVTPYSATYDATPHTAIGTATGIGGVDLSASLTLTGTTHTNAGTYASDSWSFHDASGNYADATGTVSDLIKQATANISVTPYSASYDGNAHTASATAKGVGGIDLSAGLNLNNTTHMNAGNYTTDWWTFTDSSGNYVNVAATTITDVINKANPTINVTPYNVNYDGNPHTPAATATGVKGEDLSSGLNLGNATHTNAADYPADSWTFTGGTNYNDVAATTIHDVINKANATISVTPYNLTFDGTPHTPVAIATGVKGEDLNSGLNLTNATHTNAGDYPADSWSFTGGTNYNDVAATAIHDVISKANAHINVTPYNVNYDGNPHTPGATATGVKGEDLSSGLNLGNATHTNAADYPADSWSFTGGTNYNDVAATTIHDVINKTDAHVSVTPYNVVYDGTAHTATGTATGVKGEDLSSGLNLTNTMHTNAGDYLNDSWSFNGGTNYNNVAANVVHDMIEKATANITVTPYHVTFDGTQHIASGTATGIGDLALAGLDLSHAAHTNAGSYATDYWTFTDQTGNYKDVAATTIADVIDKANANIVVTPYSVTYDVNPHTAAGSATGVGGVALAGLDLSHTEHTNAGTYAADYWTFTDQTGNYISIAATTINDVIKQANANIVVTPYKVTYDAAPHTANGTATGVGGVDLSADLALGGTTHTNAGAYATDNWSFHDPAGNYADASATLTNTIVQAKATMAFTPYSVVYDASPHTASGTATGVGGVNLNADLALAGTTHTNAGTYASDSWSFHDPSGNYADDSGTVSDTILQARASSVVTPYSVTYDGSAHTAAGSATGIGGVNLASLLTLTGTTHTNAGTYASDSWSFHDPSGNYADDSGTVSDVIQQAKASIVITPYNVTYDGSAHTATGTATGIGGMNLSGLVTLTGTTHTDAATYGSDSWSFHDTAGNYADANGTVADMINKAPLIGTADNKSMILDGTLPAFTASYTGFVAGQGPSVLSATLSCSAGTNGQTIGTFQITCFGQAAQNYSITYKTGTLTVQYAGAGICDGDVGHQIMAPINANGTSVFNSKSTSPAKFRVCDAKGISIGTPGVAKSFVLYQVVNGTVSTVVNETVDSTTPDTMFRWDPTGQQWIFNISNKNLGPANQTYFFLITLNDGTTIPFNYGLK
jgi:MBG domain (YGX type)/Galactose oxidase, central domain/Kelch motif